MKTDTEILSYHSNARASCSVDERDEMATIYCENQTKVNAHGSDTNEHVMPKLISPT